MLLGFRLVAIVSIIKNDRYEMYMQKAKKSFLNFLKQVMSFNRSPKSVSAKDLSLMFGLMQHERVDIYKHAHDI